jgi:hypothetical protein
MKLLGSFTQFVMYYNTVTQSGAFQGLVNFTNGPELVNLADPNGIVFSGTVGPVIDPNIPDGYSLEAVGRILAPELCTVSGTVQTTDGTPVAGVTVDLVDGMGNIFELLTDENGEYIFYDVAVEDLAVSVIVPLGYTPVTDTDVLSVCQACEVVVVDFVFEQSPLTDRPRTIGFWKHQVNSALRGKQNGVQVPVDDLLSLFASIHNRFDQYFDVFVPIQTLEDFRDVLTSKINRTMYLKGRSHFAAMLLNVVSGRLASWQTISDDGATVSQAITHISDLLTDSDDSNDEIAKDIADTINNGGTIAAGVIPLTITQIAYTPPVDFAEPAAVAAPKLINNVSSFPNPSNPHATITYELGSETPVTLAIYNIRGQRVRVLVDNVVQSGVNYIDWNGKDRSGRDLASGVYFFRVEAGSERVTHRMIILR